MSAAWEFSDLMLRGNTVEARRLLNAEQEEAMDACMALNAILYAPPEEPGEVARTVPAPFPVARTLAAADQFRWIQSQLCPACSTTSSMSSSSNVPASTNSRAARRTTSK